MALGNSHGLARTLLHRCERVGLEEVRLDARDGLFVQRDCLAAIVPFSADDAHAAEPEDGVVKEVPTVERRVWSVTRATAQQGTERRTQSRRVEGRYLRAEPVHGTSRVDKARCEEYGERESAAEREKRGSTLRDAPERTLRAQAGTADGSTQSTS